MKALTIVPAVLLMTIAAACGQQAETRTQNTDDQTVDILRKTSQAFTEVARRAIPAVVAVQVEITGQRAFPMEDMFDEDFLRRFFGEQGRVPAPRQMGQGSGFIISSDGYILCNNHVVGNAQRILVRLEDGREFMATRIGSDPYSEVALIKIDAQDLPVIPLGDSDAIEIGQWVIAIGNPFGLSATLTVGVVSAKGRSNIGIAEYEDFIQTDAAINPGNSGGPLLNINGQAIGINTAIFSRSGGHMGIGFAIPINMARAIKDQLLETGRVQRGYIGILIQPLTPELARSFGLEEAEGVLIAGVSEDSPAEAAGLQEGDIVTQLNGEQVTNISAFRNAIAMTPPGTPVNLSVLRDGELIALSLEVASLEETEDEQAEPVELLEQIGLRVQDLTPEDAEQLGYQQGSGVLITEIRPGSAAASVGLRPGQLIISVNREPVKTAEEFTERVTGATGNSVLLLVREGRYARFLALPLPDRQTEQPQPGTPLPETPTPEMPLPIPPVQ